MFTVLASYFFFPLAASGFLLLLEDGFFIVAIIKNDKELKLNKSLNSVNISATSIYTLQILFQNNSQLTSTFILYKEIILKIIKIFYYFNPFSTRKLTPNNFFFNTL